MTDMAQNQSKRPPGPRAQSLKAAVVDAALKILDEEGLHLGAESISYSRVFAHLENEHGIRVTRGSVHERIWSSHDEFRREVLTTALSSSPVDYQLVNGEGVQLVKSALAARTDMGTDTRTDSGTPAGATRPDIQMVTDHVLRRLVPEIARRAFESPDFLRAQSLKAMVSRSNDPLVSDTVAEAMHRRSQERLAGRRAGMATLLRAVGVRGRSALDLSAEDVSDYFFSSMWTLVVGAFLNASGGDHSAARRLDGDVGGGPGDEPWMVLSLGPRAVFRYLTEPDPRPADPSGLTGLQSLVEVPPAPDQVSSPLPSAPTGDPADDAPASGRRTREQLKQLVLQAGVELLLQGGLHLRPESLSYAAVFARVKKDTGLVVNRASVHKRFWSSHLDFCLDVLATSLQVESGPDPWPVDVEIPDVEPVEVGVAEVGLRLVTSAAIEALMTSPTMIRRMLIKASLAELGYSDGLDALRRQVRQAEEATAGRYAAALKAAVIGDAYEVRPELGLTEAEALHVCSVLFQTVVNGSAFEQSSAGLLAASTDAPTGPGTVSPTDGAAGSVTGSVAEVVVYAVFEHLYRIKA